MIISHSKKFIFIKNVKTAGTSIEYCLAKYCKNDDIFPSFIGNDVKYLKHKGRNYKTPLYKIHPHTGIKKIKKIFGEDIINNYFIFCVERNPYEKIISLFQHHLYINKFRKQNVRYKFKKIRKLFNIYVHKRKDLQGMAYNQPKYTIKDDIVVDKIVRYDNITNEINKILNELNINDDIRNYNIRNYKFINRKQYDYYDYISFKMVSNHFRKELQYFNQI